MDLSTAIKHILDGDAVILMGAGASYGVKNAFGDFPSGSRLARDLYSSCGILPDDENDLQDAAQCYVEKHSATKLIQEIRTRLSCSSFLPCHTTIYGQPWIRYYTTNYDDVALLAAKPLGINITPITLSANFKKYYDYKSLCIHINGHVGQLNENTLNNEFKLTSNSYLSQQYISTSQWGDLLVNDLEASKCVVILGLSLKYDLDLSKIIFNADITEKTIIIDSIDLSENAENRLKRFGHVFKIGVDGFANEISKISERYIPRTKNPIDQLYTCFIHEYHRPSPFSHATPSNVYDLFLCGTYANELFYKINGKYEGFVYRSRFYDIFDAISKGKKYIFIHADMGNGKTAAMEELRFKLSKEDVHVFVLDQVNLTNLSGEVASICSINETCVVIIDDYNNYMEVLRSFAVRAHSHVQFVFTARSAVNYSKMPDVFDILSIKENESAIIDINKLGPMDISRCVELFERYGAFGRITELTTEEKCKFLRSKNHGDSKFQPIMIEVMKSGEMIARIKNLVGIIEKESSNYHNAVILILVVKIMNLRISATDIERITGQEITKDAMFRANLAIQELLIFKDGKQGFSIKSPVTSSLILREIAQPEMIISALNSLAQYAVQFQYSPKYSNILTNIISFSHISSFLKEYRDPTRFLANYYDSLSQIDYYRTSNFFWLQYAISCIEISDFPRAQKYLDVAYGLAPKGFEPFQINNQQARLYLEMILKGKTSEVLDNFKSAHKLLMLPIISPKDNEYNVVKLYGYYTRKDFKARMQTAELKQFHKEACRDAYNRLSVFLKKHIEHAQNLQDLLKQLLKYSV